MSFAISTLKRNNYVLSLLAEMDKSSNIFFETQGAYSPFIRQARLAEYVTLATLTAGVGAWLARAALSALPFGLAGGAVVGIGLAYAGHKLRTTQFSVITAANTSLPPTSYKISLTTLYLDTFSILKGKWQIVEATTAGVLGVAILGGALRLSRIYPFATSLFAGVGFGVAATYIVADSLIGRFCRKI